jgi:hypothetical protein
MVCRRKAGGRALGIASLNAGAVADGVLIVGTGLESRGNIALAGNSGLVAVVSMELAGDAG